MSQQRLLLLQRDAYLLPTEQFGLIRRHACESKARYRFEPSAGVRIPLLFGGFSPFT